VSEPERDGQLARIASRYLPAELTRLDLSCCATRPVRRRSPGCAAR
jgi:hypothetical protein